MQFDVNMEVFTEFYNIEYDKHHLASVSHTEFVVYYGHVCVTKCIIIGGYQADLSAVSQTETNCTW